MILCMFSIIHRSVDDVSSIFANQAIKPRTKNWPHHDPFAPGKWENEDSRAFDQSSDYGNL